MRNRTGGVEVLDDLTDSQISLLCDIEEHDPTKSSSDAKRDLERLIAEGYVQPTADHPGSTFELTAKAVAFLGERGAGLNEA
jgi:hypothetical protein